MKLKLALSLVLLCASYFTIWRRHNEPNTLVWDEHFHIASAQKYLHAIYFQEPHPPLGKLLIALGEHLLAKDISHSEFLDFDRAPNTPENFHVEGYRLMPTLFTMASPLALFDLLLVATSNLVLSFLVAALLILDLAFSIHSRVAHLEAFQILFLLLSIGSFLRLHSGVKSPNRQSLAFGAFVGLAVATKITSLLVAPLFLLFPGTWRERTSRPLLASLSAVAIFMSTFYIHFWLGRHIHAPLDSKGYYGAPEEIRPILNAGISPTSFPIFFSEWLRFFKQYERGVPKLNLCKAQENGSYPLIWPIGGGAISYSWKRDDNITRYVYLLVNPAVWAISFIGFALGLMLLFQKVISDKFRTTEFPFSEVFTVLYGCYYAAMLHVDRVMYLYHALIPMILGLMLFALNCSKIDYLFGFKLDKLKRTAILVSMFVLSLASYLYFRPIADYQPVTDEQFRARQWFDIWNLKCANCQSENPIAKPVLEAEEKTITKDYWKVEIDGVKSTRIEQQWGDPKMNLDVDSKPIVVAGRTFETGIGTHARSKLDFIVPAGFQKFEALVGVSDQGEKGRGSVVFEVRVNAKPVFNSPVLRTGDAALPLSVTIKEGDLLELFAYDSGDGISYDHACWLTPHFIE